MQKPKRQNKTPEDILKDMEVQKKVKEGRKFVREQFFPALCKATVSINDADIFLQSFSSLIMESLLLIMRDKKFSELKIVDKLDKKSPQYSFVKDLVDIFNDKTIKEAQDLIDGMKDEIRMFYRDEMKERKLESLKIKWLPE